MDRGRRRRFRLKLKPAGYAFFGAVLLLVGVGVFFLVRALTGGGNQTALSALPSPTGTMQVPTPTPSPSPTLPPLSATAPAASVTAPVSSAPVQVSPPATSAPAAATATPSSSIRKATAEEKKNAKAGYITGNDVNLRAGPSTDYKSLGKYSANATLVVYAKDGSFYFIKMDKDDKVGFVSKSFVALGQTSTATQIVSAPSGAIGGSVSASKVALRDGASKTSTAIAELHSGDQVFIYHQKGDFYYLEVASSGKKGYAYASYISASATVPVQ